MNCQKEIEIKMKDEDEITQKRIKRAKKRAEQEVDTSDTIKPTDSIPQPKSYLPRKLKSTILVSPLDNDDHAQIPSQIDPNHSLAHRRTSVKIMTWNILAQCLVRRSLFPGSDFLKWKDRGSAITQEIVDLDPDVVCLQEVDRLADHGPILNAAGYEYSHVIGGYEEAGKQHGLLIGWKRNVFHLIGQNVVRLDEQEHESRVGLSRVTRNIGLICALAFKNNPGGLIIGTAHLFWHACFSYERARQTAFLSKALTEFKVDGMENDDITKWPVFLAGDLNEQPGGPAYRLLSGANLVEKQHVALEQSSIIHKSVDEHFGKTTEEYITLEGDEDRVFKDVRPSQSQDGLFNILELQKITGPSRWLSLYGHWGNKMMDEDDNRFMNRPGFEVEPLEDPIQSGHYEPMWTNFTPLWSCTLDYIWVLCRDDLNSSSKIEVNALLPTHKTEVLQPGLPRLGVEPSDHISLMAEISIPWQ